MSALKSANKDLKGMMKTVKISEIDVDSTMNCLLFVSGVSNLSHIISLCYFQFMIYRTCKTR